MKIRGEAGGGTSRETEKVKIVSICSILIVHAHNSTKYQVNLVHDS